MIANCPRIAQRDDSHETRGSTGCFTYTSSLLLASWTWFQDRIWRIAETHVRRRFSQMCISLRNPWARNGPRPFPTPSVANRAGAWLKITRKRCGELLGETVCPTGCITRCQRSTLRPKCTVRKDIASQPHCSAQAHICW